MITEKTYRGIDLALKQTTKMCMIPFTWNSAQFKLSPVVYLSPKHLFWPLSVWAYSAVLLVSKYANSEALASDQVKKVLHTNFLIIYTCVAVVVLNVMLKREELASLFNQYFRFIQKLDGAGHVNQHLDIPYVILTSALYISYSHSFSGLFLYFEFPRNPNYLYSLIPEAYESWWLLVACGTFEFAFYVNLWQYAIFSFIMMFPFFYGTLYWLREITHQRNRPKQLSSESTYAIYKCFQILAQEFNCCFAEITLPSVQFYLILLAVTANHILLLHYHELSPTAFAVVICVSAVAILSVFIIFPNAAAVNSLSIRFVKTLGAKAKAQAHQQGQLQLRLQIPVTTAAIVAAGPSKAGPQAQAQASVSTITKKHVRACFPLKIRINSFPYIVRFTTLKIVGLIFYWTVRSVLLTRN